MSKGVSIISSPLNDNKKGVSLVSHGGIDNKFGVSLISTAKLDNKFGISVVSKTNLFVQVIDILGNPLAADIQITGGLNVDGTYVGFSDYGFTSDSAVGVTFEASRIGYTTNQVISDVNEFGDVTIIIQLEPNTLTFSCTTVAKNSNGVTVSKAISSGYLEVVFTGSSPFDPDNYLFSFNAYIPGNSKYSVVTLFGEETSRTTYTVTFKFNLVDSNQDFCYIPNISSKQC